MKAATLFYRTLLYSYPASFRAEYGPEMTTIFARRFSQARTRCGRISLIGDAIIDAARNAPVIHADILRQDLRLAVRGLTCMPLFSVTVTLVAALGIGATTAAFSLADHVLLRPLPFRSPIASSRFGKIIPTAATAAWNCRQQLSATSKRKAHRSRGLPRTAPFPQTC